MLNNLDSSNVEVAIIGSHCSNLKTLDLSDVVKITDDGVRTLFKKVDLVTML
jgi:hypothetical protein